MKIAYTMAPGRGDMDGLLLQVANTLISRGFHPAGTVQINTERPGDGPCDMDVKILPKGPALRISQHLGTGAKGCRLNPEALETAVAHVARDLARPDAPPECLIINKFGKHEAEGRGFRDVIAQALIQDIPVLVGVNALNRDAFLEFSDGLAEEVPATLPDLLAWFERFVCAPTA